jgi:hypothetical protein
MKAAIPKIAVEPDMFANISSFVFKALSLLLVFLAPIKAILCAVIFLVIIDMITGVWASFKRKEPITSNGLRHTVTKMLAYMTCVVTGFVVETNLIPDLPLIKIIAAMIAMTEMKSFFENITDISGVDFWSAVLKKLNGNRTFPGQKNKRKKGK